MTSRIWLLSITLTLFFSTVLADDYKDFRIPDHRAFSLSTSFAGSFNRHDWDSESFSKDEQRWYGEASGSLLLLRDSDRFRSITWARLSAYGNHETDESANYGGSTTSSSNNNRSVGEAASASWNGWLYPAAPPFGFYGSFNGSVHTGQFWQSHRGAWSAADGDFVHTIDGESWSYDYRVAFSGGPAYGRVRDVTNLYNVLIAEQRLIEDGVLNGTLKLETRQKLAGLFFDKKYYPYTHQRYSKYFWRDVENALRDDPAFISAKFDNYSLFHMFEPTFAGSSFSRACGWTISPIISASHENQIFRGDTREFVHIDSAGVTDVDTLNLYWQRGVSQDDYVTAGYRLSYNKPLNLHWQVDISSQCLFDVEPPDHGFGLINQVAVNWEIADRWHTQFEFQHQRERHDDSKFYYRYNTANSWQLFWQAQVNYFIEEKTSIYATLSHTRGKNNDFYSHPLETVDSAETFFGVGLTYQFFGGLSSYNSPFDEFFGNYR